MGTTPHPESVFASTTSKILKSFLSIQSFPTRKIHTKNCGSLSIAVVIYHGIVLCARPRGITLPVEDRYDLCNLPKNVAIHAGVGLTAGIPGFCCNTLVSDVIGVKLWDPLLSICYHICMLLC